jgi:hypothetical protein
MRIIVKIALASLACVALFAANVMAQTIADVQAIAALQGQIDAGGANTQALQQQQALMAKVPGLSAADAVALSNAIATGNVDGANGVQAFVAGFAPGSTGLSTIAKVLLDAAQALNSPAGNPALASQLAGVAATTNALGSADQTLAVNIAASNPAGQALLAQAGIAIPPPTLPSLTPAQQNAQLNNSPG